VTAGLRQQRAKFYASALNQSEMSVALAHICGETANILCHDGPIAGYITGVHDEDDGFSVSYVLAELFANTRVARNIHQSGGILV
jgi:hypothetical protein